MSIRNYLLGLLLATVSSVAMAAQGHQVAGNPTAGAAEVAQCLQAQPIIAQMIEAAMSRLEMARQTNSAPAMRGAVDDFQGVLRDLRAQLAPCAQIQAVAASPHAGPVMPATPQAPAASPGTAVARPESTEPAPAAVAPAAAAPAGGPRTPATQPRPTAPAPSAVAATANPHAGHVLTTAANPATNVQSLMCQTTVDPKTAPRATYQERTYYFCTEQDRAEFAKAPAKYVKAPAR